MNFSKCSSYEKQNSKLPLVVLKTGSKKPTDVTRPKLVEGVTIELSSFSNAENMNLWMDIAKIVKLLKTM